MASTRMRSIGRAHHEQESRTSPRSNRRLQRVESLRKVSGWSDPTAAAVSATSLPRWRSRWTAKSFFLGTVLGHICLMVVVAALLILMGAALWLLSGDCSGEEQDGPGCITAGRSSDRFGDALWFSYTLFIDPGTQTGLVTSAPGKFLIAAAFSVIGFIYCLVVLGLIVETVRSTMDRLRRRHYRLVANGHTVVLGWTDKTIFLVNELAAMLSDGPDGGGQVVVLGDWDQREMTEELLQITFPDWNQRWPRVSVLCRSGKARLWAASNPGPQ